MKPSRSWVWTLNNYTPEEIEAIEANSDKFRYLCFGKEVGKNGTPHLQGFVYFRNAVRMATVKSVVGVRAHCEIAKGNVDQNRGYCSKDSTEENPFVEIGEKPMSQCEKGAANKRRYEEAWEAAVEGRLDDIDADLRIRHYNTIKRIRMDKIAERDLTDTTEQMEWYYGESGTGKSRKARTENPDAYLKMCNKWWDSYVDQSVVLIEDFDVKHSVLVHHLKIWLDRYPFLAEIKGGSVKIRPKKIIVTSNYHPRDIWTDERDLEPILRRVKVTHFQNLM